MPRNSPDACPHSDNPGHGFAFFATGAAGHCLPRGSSEAYSRCFGSLPRSLAPSLLPAGFGNLAAAAGEVASGADWLHVKLMDAHFVPDLTIGSLVVVSLEKHTGELSWPKYAHRIRVYFELVQRVLRPRLVITGAGPAKSHSHRDA